MKKQTTLKAGRAESGALYHVSAGGKAACDSRITLTERVDATQIDILYRCLRMGCCKRWPWALGPKSRSRGRGSPSSAKT